MTRARALGCALWMGLGSVAIEAQAEEAADEARKPEVEPPESTHRFALGATWGGVGGAVGMAGLGGLAGMPSYHLAYEPRVARMLRLLVRVEGAYSSQSTPGAESEGFSMGGRLGLREATPLPKGEGCASYSRRPSRAPRSPRSWSAGSRASARPTTRAPSSDCASRQTCFVGATRATARAEG